MVGPRTLVPVKEGGDQRFLGKIALVPLYISSSDVNTENLGVLGEIVPKIKV